MASARDDEQKLGHVHDESVPAFDWNRLLADPTSALLVPEHLIPAAIVRLSAVQSAFACRIEAASRERSHQGDESLLDIAQAAARLSVTEDWLYRHARRLPFTRKLDGLLRFSSRGIDRFIRDSRAR